MNIEKDKPIYRYIPNTCRRSSDDSRTIVTINTDTVDRYGTVIDPDGGDMTNYKRNPVFMINHDPNLLAGNGSNVRMQDGKLIAEVADEDWDKDDPMIERWYNKVKKGFMRASSIQFIPKEYHEEEREYEDGKKERYTRITNWELLEWSFVTLPGNPDAVRSARSVEELMNPDLAEEIKELRDLMTGTEYIDRVAERILEIWTPSAPKGSARKAKEEMLAAPEVPERKATDEQIQKLIAKQLGL